MADFYNEIYWAYSISFLKTLAIPSISKTLFRTGKLESQTSKRDDDTRWILYFLTVYPKSSPEFTAALKYMNQSHARMGISNQDYLYVLSLYIVFTIDCFRNGLGPRRLTSVEETAWFETWVDIGRLMKIQDLPKSLQEIRTYYLDYEKKYVRFDPVKVK